METRPGMFERYTERAKAAVSAARSEALRHGSDYVRTEHLLLGLCRDPEGIAARTLENLGVDIQMLAADIERQVQPGTRAATREEITMVMACLLAFAPVRGGRPGQYARLRKFGTVWKVIRLPSWAFLARWSPDRDSTTRFSPSTAMDA